jgi:hypothetical protein
VALELARHHDVGEQQVDPRLAALEHRQRRTAIGGLDHAIAAPGQRRHRHRYRLYGTVVA